MLNTLIKEAEEIAKQEADGHLTMLRFTTGWKVFIGTPNLDIGEERERISSMTSFESLNLALRNFIEHHNGHIETIKSKTKKPLTNPIIIEKLDTPYNKYLDQKRKDEERRR